MSDPTSKEQVLKDANQEIALLRCLLARSREREKHMADVWQHRLSVSRIARTITSGPRF